MMKANWWDVFFFTRRAPTLSLKGNNQFVALDYKEILDMLPPTFTVSMAAYIWCMSTNTTGVRMNRMKKLGLIDKSACYKQWVKI